MNSTGTNTAKAVRLLNQAGVTVASIAVDLAVSPATVYRWRTGARRPNPGNFAALRGLVNELHAGITNRRGIASQAQADLLEAAKDALLTPGERARLDQMAAEIRDRMAARRQAEMPQQRRSAYSDVDPFALVEQDDEMRTVEAIFG